MCVCVHVCVCVCVCVHMCVGAGVRNLKSKNRTRLACVFAVCQCACPRERAHVSVPTLACPRKCARAEMGGARRRTHSCAVAACSVSSALAQCARRLRALHTGIQCRHAHAHVHAAVCLVCRHARQRNCMFAQPIATQAHAHQNTRTRGRTL